MENLSAEKRFLLQLPDAELRRLLALAVKHGGSLSSGSRKKFELSDGVKARLKRISASRGTSKLDRDDALWADYVGRISKLEFSKHGVLDDGKEKSVYRAMRAACEKRHLPEDFSLEMSSSLLEYMKTGHTKPILIYGPAGCGKTEAAIILAELLHKRYYLTSATACDHRHGILGEGSAYKSPDIGELWRGILQTETLNPVIIVDEIDKITKSVEHLSIEDEFLSILNDEQMMFTDNFLGFPATLRTSLLIFTCNDIEAVSEPLRDRCSLYAFKAVPLERMQHIISDYALEKIQKDYADTLTLRSEALQSGVCALYQRGVHSIRQHKALVDNSFKRAYGIYLSSERTNVPVVEGIYMEQVNRLCRAGRIARTAGFTA